MADDSSGPLSVGEAKRALRNCADRARPRRLLLDHPLGLLALAFCGGVIAGNTKTRRLSASILGPLLAYVLNDSAAPRHHAKNQITGISAEPDQ